MCNVEVAVEEREPATQPTSDASFEKTKSRDVEDSVKQCDNVSDNVAEVRDEKDVSSEKTDEDVTKTNDSGDGMAESFYSAMSSLGTESISVEESIAEVKNEERICDGNSHDVKSSHDRGEDVVQSHDKQTELQLPPNSEDMKSDVESCDLDQNAELSERVAANSSSGNLLEESDQSKQRTSEDVLSETTNEEKDVEAAGLYPELTGLASDSDLDAAMKQITDQMKNISESLDEYCQQEGKTITEVQENALPAAAVSAPPLETADRIVQEETATKYQESPKLHQGVKVRQWLTMEQLQSLYYNPQLARNAMFVDSFVQVK